MKKPVTFPPRPAGGLLNREQAAAKLGISPETLKKWTTQRRIPIVKMGSAVRYRESDLDAYIDAHVVQPVAR